MEWLEDIKFDEKGLVPAIAQDYQTKEVLMLAYMNKEAILKTIETGYATYYSRSRESLWCKGEVSGHTQKIISMNYDCDGDTILLTVEQIGAACHTGHVSCFYRNIDADKNNQEIQFDSEAVYSASILKKVYDVIQDRKANPIQGSYTNYLFEKGIDKILKKVGEENAEVIIAAKNHDSSEIIYEVSDLFYHLMVLLVEENISLEQIYRELEGRHKV